jgi:DNA polymerase
VLNPRRHPPRRFATVRGPGQPAFNFLLRTVDPRQVDVASDDAVLMALQYSTQWDSFAHIGALFDADGDGVAEPVYYNGFRAGVDVVAPAWKNGPVDWCCAEGVQAKRLGIETMAAAGVQGRGVLIDLHAVAGRERRMLGWAELRAAVAACRACRLCEGRKQTVFGVGHAQAHWMVIGEAPGAQEDEQGEPFVGAAGQLLDAMLRALDLSRAAEGDAARRVFIANTLKCRPPGNRNPQPDEMAQCEPFLLRQIELVRPRLILAMGRFAVQALLRTTEPIGRLRGKVHRYRGVPLVVTYHPAYLLRNLHDKARAWEDLCLAAEVAEVAESVASVEGAAPAR